MLKIKYRVLSWAWGHWHMWLPRHFNGSTFTGAARKTVNFVTRPIPMPRKIRLLRAVMDWDNRTIQKWYENGRPSWHLCCNGNHGGWRTAVCDWLEEHWRDLEHELEDIRYG